jgi:hypothetical protein
MSMHRITPVRAALAVAAAAVAGNLYLLTADALAPQSSASVRHKSPSIDQAARGRLPGEPKSSRETLRWKTQ